MDAGRRRLIVRFAERRDAAGMSAVPGRAAGRSGGAVLPLPVGGVGRGAAGPRPTLAPPLRRLAAAQRPPGQAEVVRRTAARAAVLLSRSRIESVLVLFSSFFLPPRQISSA